MSVDLGEVRRAYVAALMARDTTRARAVVEDAIDQGSEPAAIDLAVLAPAMRDIGDLWVRGEASVADEHYASGVTEGIMAVLAARMRMPPSSGRLAVVTCPPNERHALGGRMLADLLEAHSWEVLLLGPDMPLRALLELCESEQPDAVAVSVTMPELIDTTVEVLASLSTLDPAPFLAVGGQAFNGRAAELGADLVSEAPGDLVAELYERFPPHRD